EPALAQIPQRARGDVAPGRAPADRTLAGAHRQDLGRPVEQPLLLLRRRFAPPYGHVREGADPLAAPVVTLVALRAALAVEAEDEPGRADGAAVEHLEEPRRADAWGVAALRIAAERVAVAVRRRRLGVVVEGQVDDATDAVGPADSLECQGSLLSG